MISDDTLVTPLLQNHIFAACAPGTLEKFMDKATVRTDPRKTVIASDNQFFPYLGFVIEGVIGVTASAKRGRDVRLYEAAALQTFGEAAFLGEDVALGRICVISKSATYALLPKYDVVEAARSDAAFLWRLARQGAVRSRELTDRLMSQAVDSILSRVASVLLPFAMDGEGLIPADPALLSLSQVDIAASAGTVKEVAARAIADLEKSGALRRERGHVRYLDRAKLLLELSR